MREEHPANAKKSDEKLLLQAESAMLDAVTRHFRHEPMVMQTTIPASSDDTDVIVMDALARTHHIIEQRNELLEACKMALGAFENNNAIDWGLLEQAIAKAENSK